MSDDSTWTVRPDDDESKREIPAEEEQTQPLVPARDEHGELTFGDEVIGGTVPS